jgi:hypothetical protein
VSLPDKAEAVPPHVDAYKRVLQQVLDSRPSGMRQRLAEALGKNRSFISLISNPAYPTPIPVQHVERIFEICHFSQKEKDQFLASYRRAHPRRLQLHRERDAGRRLTLEVPDLGDAAANRKLDAILAELATKLAQLLKGS